MSSIETRTRYPNDLLRMADAKQWELVDGELVERHMGWQSSRIGGTLVRFLGNHCAEHALGRVTGADAGYQCFADAPNKVRKPDASFLSYERLPADQEPTGHCKVCPDLVVEVVSPNDEYSAVEAKVEEYLGAGARLVWVVDPPTRSVRVHRPQGDPTDLHREDELDGEDVLPGFRLKLAELFGH